MDRASAFSSLPVLVFFLFVVVPLTGQAINDGQTHSQQLENPSTIKQALPLVQTTITHEDIPQAATVLFSQPPKPPLQPTPPSVPNVSVVQQTTTTTTTTTPPPQTYNEYVPTTPPPKTITDPSCPPLDGDLDSLTLNQFFTKLTQECRYDKVTKPNKPEPLPVTLEIDIMHIEAIEQLKFKLHMLMQYRYIDYRLRYDDVSPKRGVMLGELLRDKIWIPHVVLSNERESSIMGLEGNDQFVSISPYGEVVFSYRMTATIYCWMDLKKFPFDTQNCDLTFRSWTYNASKLILRWNDKESPVKVANQLHLTEFSLIRYSTYSKLVSASLSQGAFVGNYSLLVFEFMLQREIGYYVMDYFIPSILLVVTSWVTFWLQADNAAPRITLGTSTMLAFITLAQGQTRHLPKVSYIKASEIWFLGCTVFIFASMVEFAFVNIIWRRRKKVELKKVNSKYILKSTLTPRLARKELQRSASMSNLHKSHSCSSLADCNHGRDNTTHYNNYLTVHSFPSTLDLPKITMQNENDLISADSQVTIPVPNSANESVTLQKWTSMTPQEVAIWIDKRSRIVFPCAFLVFNIFYWAFVYGL